MDAEKLARQLRTARDLAISAARRTENTIDFVRCAGEADGISLALRLLGEACELPEQELDEAAIRRAL